MISGVTIIPLKQIPDERGKIMQMLRSDSPNFEKFGEIYFSCIYPDAIKAWHIHKIMTLNYAVVHGMIKFVLYDERINSPTYQQVQEIFMGESNYCLVSVPPLVWNGFKGIGSTMSIVANCPTHAHSPDEIERLNPFSERIPYNWELKNG